jgi:hypothetical protein
MKRGTKSLVRIARQNPLTSFFSEEAANKGIYQFQLRVFTGPLRSTLRWWLSTFVNAPFRLSRFHIGQERLCPCVIWEFPGGSYTC